MRLTPILGTLTIAASTFAGDTFQDGQVYLITSNWPGLGGVVARVDPVTGDKEVIYDFPEFGLENSISYDPYRDRIIVMPDPGSETFRLLAADGSFTELENPWSQWDIADWAPTGDGRIYQVANVGTFGWIDADNNGYWLKDEDGTTNFSMPYGATHREHLIYDSITNSLFLVYLQEATHVVKIPLSDDGSKLRAPAQTVTFDAFANEFDEPTGMSAGPNGKIFIKIRAASNNAGLLMFLIDPVTLAFEPYAYIQHTFSAWNVPATYISSVNQAMALDTWGDVMRMYSQGGGTQEGSILCSGVSGPGTGDFVGMMSVGDTINGGPLPPDDCADLNGDSTVDVNDLLAILAAWGSCSGCPEDVNNDGTVDVNDLLDTLSDWGPC